MTNSTHLERAMSEGLAEFVRSEKRLRLPEAIRKMTSFPAQRLGLRDRGILRDGFKADIVILTRTKSKPSPPAKTRSAIPQA